MQMRVGHTGEGRESLQREIGEAEGEEEDLGEDLAAEESWGVVVRSIAFSPTDSSSGWLELWKSWTLFLRLGFLAFDLLEENFDSFEDLEIWISAVVELISLGRIFDLILVFWMMSSAFELEL